MKKKILIIVGIIVAIFAIIKIWECTIGFKFKNQSEFRRFTSKIENMSDVTGYLLNSITLEKIEIEQQDVQKVLELISEAKVKPAFDSMVGSGYIFELKNNKDGSECRIIVMSTQVKIPGIWNSLLNYTILDNEDYTLFNQIKTIGEKYRNWEY